MALNPSASPAAPTADGPPVFLLLLDGYPRIDALADLGIDNQPFIEELEKRGFDHYPDAYSLHTFTHLTLTAMLTGRVGENRYGSVEQRRAEQAAWSLPPGFVAVTPPGAHVTIPNARDIGPRGIAGFDIEVVGQSLLGHVPGIDELLMDALRNRLRDSLQIVAETDESRLFAHMPVPHPLFLYGPDGLPFPPPSCWPSCSVPWLVAGGTIPREEWLPGLTGTLRYLNVRLVRIVDSIIAKRPDAVIVLFSDHGGRFSYNDPGEWHQTLLVARTPQRPMLFKNTPRPDMVIQLVIDPA